MPAPTSDHRRHPGVGPLAGLVALVDPVTERHDPQSEIWVGVRTPATEVPGRVAAIRTALTAAGADLRTGMPQPAELEATLHRVHHPDLVAYLRTATDHWADGDYRTQVGQDRVVPYVFPTEGLLDGLPARVPVAAHARAGLFCYDTMTLVGPGTWEAALAAAGLAQAAADLVSPAAGATTGTAVYALCRPPGHHVTPRAYGGSCYLNNAAVAADTLRNNGFDIVSVIDIDAHHGNGTQAVFYDRPDVHYGSVHIDPGAGWFPHYAGFADETGRGPGLGANRNLPLPPGSGDVEFLAAIGVLVEATGRAGAQALVVSLGVDAAIDDPESPLRVSADGFRQAGRLLAELGLPTVLVQEGGYHLESLGRLVVAVLEPFASRRGAHGI